MISDQASISGSHSPLGGDLETSLAPREGDILSLPFDQYGRMRIAQNLAHILYTEIAQQSDHRDGPYKLRVLDVGGYPGNLRNFLNADYFDLSILDVVPDDGSIPGYKQGSGMELPYAEGEFDIVFSLDTLEHIPGKERSLFLSEVMRVARLGVVLINPIQSLPADLAEETLDEYIRWLLDAQQEQLAEHRAFGLPDFPGTIAAFQHGGWITHDFKLANVYNWLFMMIAKHYLLSMRDERAAAFERALDRYYNLTFFEDDRSEPAYRGAIIAVRPGLESALKNIDEAYPPVAGSDTSNTTRLALTEVLMSLLNLKAANHEDRLLREQMEHKDKNIADMQTLIVTRDLQLDAQRGRSDALLQASSAQINALKDQLETSNKEIANLQEHVRNIEAAYKEEFGKQKAYIARLEEDRQSKDEHILYLERLLKGIEAGRVFRLTRTITRLIKR
jgi:hypothetical protein